MTELEIRKEKNKINELSRLEIAGLLRFADSNHIYIQNKELHDALMNRFNLLGGWSAEISKALGWR